MEDDEHREVCTCRKCNETAAVALARLAAVLFVSVVVGVALGTHLDGGVPGALLAGIVAVLLFALGFVAVYWVDGGRNRSED
jgi:putative effector of murein hydrolase LrgA (UPF0299 family)